MSKMYQKYTTRDISLVGSSCQAKLVLKVVDWYIFWSKHFIVKSSSFSLKFVVSEIGIWEQWAKFFFQILNEGLRLY